RTLAEDLDCSTGYARLFVQSFHNSYPEVEPWLQSVIWRARREQSIRTLFNWNMGVGAGTSYRALRNFNMQANCAEMFRLAIMYAVESGATCIAAPLHDGFLITAPEDQIDHQLALVKAAMLRASEVVLPGYSIAPDVSEPVRWPDHYFD